MRFFILLFITLFIFSCDSGKRKTNDNQNVKAQGGGVDVGNMSSSAVPNTNAYFEFPETWTSKIEGNLLILENASFSKIEASKVILEALSSSDSTALKKYLEEKHPNREYKIINFSGIEGVRAELTNTDQTRMSDIYLISDPNNIIHVVSELNNADDGFIEGEKIISTVRVKYVGAAYKDAPVTEIDLRHQKDHVTYKYSFTKGCWEDEGCGGSMFELQDYILSIKGNIVELGPEDKIPFDSIKVEGEFLTAPESKFSIADIYADERGQSSLRIKDGFNYLIRVDDGPEEGLILKLKVAGELDGENLVMYFQKLVAVKPEIQP